MHISEGVLKPEILIAGSALSSMFTLWAFKTLKVEEIPKTAVLCALFFLASFIHIPLGPSSVHLVLGGIVGAFLGLRAFIAIFVALLLQGILFGYGGISTLGVNLFNLAAPALLAKPLFALSPLRLLQKYTVWFLVGSLPLLCSSLLLSATLFFNGELFASAAWLILISYLPLIVIEGFITLFALRFIEKVSPLLMQRKLT